MWQSLLTYPLIPTDEEASQAWILALRVDAFLEILEAERVGDMTQQCSLTEVKCRTQVLSAVPVFPESALPPNIRLGLRL